MLRSIRDSFKKKKMPEEVASSGEGVLSHVALSLCGRDAGSYFIITEIADRDHVMIADGKVRRVEKPKKKKLKHLRIDDYAVEGGKIELGKVLLTNREARAAIAAFITRGDLG